MHRRMLVVLTLAIVTSFVVLEVGSAWARAGAGSSSTGSRGSRSYSAPARPEPGAPRPATPSPVSPAPMARRPSPFGGFMGAIGGFMLGGLLGGLLFGGLGHGMGIGLLDILLIGGGLLLLIAFMRRRSASPEPAYAGAPSGGSSSGGPMYAAAVETPAAVSDLERGVGHIRQMDGGFDPNSFGATARSMFLAVQDAVNRRVLGGIRDSLTPEMITALQAQCDGLRQARRSNRMARIDVRRAEVSEAWQESGQDFVTVCLAGEMLDWVVDDATGAVVDGSDTKPQPFEEYWTFVRPVGPSRFKLTAIQQG